MKHVFICPNPISYLISRGVINTLNLPKNACHILTTRDFNIPQRKNISCTFLSFSPSDFPWSKNFLKCWFAIVKLNHWVNFNIRDNFKLYLPHDKQPLYQLLRSHKSCKSRCYIEEGGLSYLTYEELCTHQISEPKLWDKLISHIGYLGRQRSCFIETFTTRNAEAFCVRESAFPWSSNKHIINNPFKRYQTSNTNVTCDTILALTHFMENGAPKHWTRQEYERAINRLAMHCKTNHIKNVGIKSHPSQHFKRFEKGFAATTLSNQNIQVTELPQHFFLENALLSQKTTVITIDSSLLIYSPYFNGKLKLLSDFHDDIGELTSRVFTSWPESLRQFVHSSTFPH